MALRKGGGGKKKEKGPGGGPHLVGFTTTYYSVHTESSILTMLTLRTLHPFISLLCPSTPYSVLRTPYSVSIEKKCPPIRTYV